MDESVQETVQNEAMDYEALQEQRNDELTALLDNRSMRTLKQRMEEMNEFDVAEFLSGIEDNRMPMVFRLLSKETAADVFANFDVPDQERIINSMTDSELAGIIEELYVDDAVDLMEELPANVVKRVMRTATPQTRALINQYLHYPEDSAGSIMTSEFVSLNVRLITSFVIIVGFHTTSNGSLPDLFKHSTISFECAATCERHSSP